MDVKIEESWKKALASEFSKPYFQNIKKGILESKSKGIDVFPPGHQIFNAFDTTPFHQVKVVILGQDPYPTPGHAMGLSFSVPKGVKPPRSLNRIYQELSNDVGFVVPNHGDLTSWAKQGVFLLNAILTVESGRPASHSKIGWSIFTDAVISTISDSLDSIVFMLWGNFAKSKSKLIDANKHLILTSAHPSPLAGNAFFGNHHFSKANEFLISQQKEKINWQI